MNPERITTQLERILASHALADAVRSQQFLRHVVNETLEGRAGRIKGVTIANEVFQLRDPEQAQTSTVVRVEAGRLRRRLELYYATDGLADPVRISIPKGSYVPNFVPNTGEDGGAGVTPSPEPPKALRPFRTPKVGLTSLATLGTLIALAALLWALWPSQAHRAASDPTSPAKPWQRPSIAVLLFEEATYNLGGKALGAGLAEDVITDLSKLSGIDVIALSSVLPYRERKASPQQIRRELGVTHVLYGSIRGTPEKLRVTAQLHETETGNHVWAGRFDREFGDILALQDELAVKIVDGMAVGLHGDEHDRLSSGQPENAEAYTLYKQALGLMNPPNDLGRLMAARRAFQRVIELDPGFAGGYTGTAYTHAFVAFWGRSESPAEETQRALELLEKAQAIDPVFGLTYSTRAIAYMALREFDKALIASTKAIEVQPSDPYVSVYHAAVLLASGQAEASVEYAQRALRLDPLSARTPYLNILGTAYFHSGEYRKALSAFQRNMERGGPFGAHIQAYVTATHVYLGNAAEAQENIKTLRMYSDDFSWKDWIRRWHKEPKEAERLLSKIRALEIG